MPYPVERSSLDLHRRRLHHRPRFSIASRLGRQHSHQGLIITLVSCQREASLQNFKEVEGLNLYARGWIAILSFACLFPVACSVC
nr:xylulose 5-phosphate/phosphate translocator, chloroplastic [Ipomoea batatas]